jgi:phospholipase D1/2
VTVPPFLRNRLVQIALAFIAVAVALTLAWRFTPLRDIVTAERVVDWLQAFSGYWWAPFALAAVYTPASVVMFPRPLLTLAAVVAFGPWKGFAIAMGGILANALAGYAIGRMLKKETVKRLGGPKLERVGKMLRKEGLLAVATVGLLPVAPFFAEMLAFGALRLKLRHVVPGVALANLPGTLGTTLLGDQLAAALSNERSLNAWIVVAIVAAMAAIAWFSRRYWQRLQAA